MKKICNKCGVEKPISDFYLQKTNKDGYTNQCKMCKCSTGKEYRKTNEINVLEHYREYYKVHKLEKQAYINANKESILNKAKKYRNNNANIISEKKKLFYKANRETIIASQNEYYKKKIIDNPLFKLKKQIQVLIINSFKSYGIKKNNRTTNILGCTIDEFKIHLESKFEPWMNWNNKGLYNGKPNFGWDIDHIIPSSSAITEEGIIKLNHYTNLRPLCSYTNRVIKRNKILL